MNIMELGAIGELVGGVAVIGSLIYVGAQIRHNARAVESSMHVQLAAMTTSMMSLVIGDDDVADLVRRGRDDPDSLNPTEWIRFVEFGYLRFGMWETAFLAHEKGTADNETWMAWDGASRSLTEGPGYDRFWGDYGADHAPAFRRYVDGARSSGRRSMSGA